MELFPNCKYEPELCPAVMLKYNSLTFMIYMTKSVVIVGLQPRGVVIKDLLTVIKTLEQERM